MTDNDTTDDEPTIRADEITPADEVVVMDGERYVIRLGEPPMRVVELSDSKLSRRMHKLADIAGEEPEGGYAEPKFLMAGDVPNYEHRLPPDYLACLPLGTHAGHRVVYYSVRSFEVDQDGRKLYLNDGDATGEEHYEAEFCVTVPLDNIVRTKFIERGGYEGKRFEEI